MTPRLRHRASRVASAAAALVLVLLGGACQEGAAPAGAGAALPQGAVRVTIGDDVVRAEVVRNAEQKALGLGGRPGLAPGTGMLFVFEEPGYPAFWMQGMRFDLDLVWARDARIVDVTPNVPRPPPGPDPGAPPLPVYRPRVPADLVLEVPAGTAAASGWQVGDAFELDPPVTASPPGGPP